jgi:hypothetical protein
MKGAAAAGFAGKADRKDGRAADRAEGEGATPNLKGAPRITAKSSANLGSSGSQVPYVIAARIACVLAKGEQASHLR